MAYQFNGIDPSDQSSFSVSSAGDVTGDGIDDLIIGAHTADPNGNGSSGEAYLISGADLVALDNATANGGTAGDGMIELADVAAIGTSYQINGIARGDLAGISVSLAGDVTGDGVDDLIIGATSADPNGNTDAGESYLISGADLAALDNATANGGTAGDGVIELADVAAIGTSYQFNGIDPGDNSALIVSSAGDVTGDGVDDLIIGARAADPNGDTDAGESYLVSGADLAALDNATANGGTAGDGIIELADVAALSSSGGTSYQFNGIDVGDNSGHSVSNAGDVTGDGVDDLIIGAYQADPNGDGGAGESYLISGADLAALDNATANGGTAADGIIELADVAAIGTSYQFNGIDAGDNSGHSVSYAGDVTGDGVDDLIIGAFTADPNGDSGAGESYLISGTDLAALDNATANGGTAGDGVIELADVAAIGTSYQFNGIDRDDNSGYSVASAGDVTGDGIDDLIIGARFADPNGKSVAGESYLISGADLVALDNATASGGTAGDGIIELADVAAVGTSYQFNGIDTSDRAGYSISAAGDVTGDGQDDLIIGAYSGDANGKVNAGESYLISGADLAALDNATANGGTAGDGIIELADVAALCFGEGTWIATKTGERRVETLQIGDHVRTDEGRLTEVLWIGRKTIYPRFGHDPKLEPVHIAKGALGNGLPTSDLCVSADHGMVLADLVINAQALVNGTTIRFVPAAEMPHKFTYYHIETEAHEVVLANGAPAETYVDVRDRRNFDNYAEYLELYGTERLIPEMTRRRISSRRLVPLARVG